MLIFLILSIIVCIVFYSIYLGFHPKQQKDNYDINKVFNEINKKYKPLDKINVIQELFLDCAKFSYDNLYEKNDIIVAIYTGELALHIFSLWFANYSKKYQKAPKEIDKFIGGMNLKAYIIGIKKQLNLLITEIIKQKEIDDDIVISIILSRIFQIYAEKDMETRNLNFMNICNLAIQYEEDTVFVVGNIEEMPIAFGNPLNMLYLPTAYKTGLVDKYLEKLEKAL